MSKTQFTAQGTVIDTDFCQSIYGQGADGGHKHDGIDADGHAGKIDESQLTDSIRESIGLIGEIKMYASRNLPRNYLFCDGNPVIGDEFEDFRNWARENATYLVVADGTVHTPNMQCRIPIGIGSASVDMNDAGQNINMTLGLGDIGGNAKHQLTIPELARHSHSVNAEYTEHVQERGSNESWRSATRTGEEGENKPHNNMPPYLVVNFIIRARR
jgi:microcystin-dependent protein